jgi:RHS repeat-associated protein
LKFGAGARTYFHYNDEGLAGEYNGAGNELRTYGYQPGSPWSTNPLFIQVGGEYYWYQNDHLGTPQKIISANGTVVWSARYDSFGLATVGVETVKNNLRFPGQYFDQETGLHYNWHRFYDPETGRYVSADPIGLDGGINLYAYVENDPVNWVDPWGLLAIGVSAGGGSGIGTGSNSSGTPNYGSASTGVVFGSSTEGGSAAAIYPSTDLGNIFGGNIGAGIQLDIYGGNVEEMDGKGVGGTLFLGLGSITVSKDQSKNWGVSISLGGKGWGFGVAFHQTKTMLIKFWDSDYGKGCK